MRNVSKRFDEIPTLRSAGLSHLPEWTILRTLRVNALIVGAVHLTTAAVAGIATGVRHPMVWWTPEQAFDVPDLTSGTLVIRDVDRLEERQQERLMQWMSTYCPCVQVLAMARAPLFPQVLDGRFSSALYYRINTAVVEVRALADLP
jgi:hypothetical protein